MFDFLSHKISSIFSRLGTEKKLTQETIKHSLEQVHDALLEADVPFDVVKEFTKEIEKAALGVQLTASLRPGEMLAKIVHDKMLHFLGGASSQTSFAFDIPSTVMVIGLQGSGKTTTVAKLAQYAQDQAKKRGKTRKVMVASVDFYRPAAIDQLEILAGQVGALFYRSPLTQPVAAAQDIMQQAQKERVDILFLDTAGRLHVDDAMLDELQIIHERVKPKYTFLVIDAMTGQESLSVAQTFDKKIGFMGAILTKMDSDTRGGVAFAFRYALKKPLLFVTVGEKSVDLEQFRPERMVSRIMGHGDVATLMERAEEKIKKSDQDALERSMSQGKLTLDDFAKQMDMMGKLGSLSSIMKYLPGMGSLALSPEMLEKGETEMKKFKAIIYSMTPKERRVTKLLDGSRKKRIAQGAGVDVADVNSLLTRFEQSQQMMKTLKNMDRSFLRK